MLQISALWKKEKNGKTYLSGKLGNSNLLVFPNSYKEEDKHPDYLVYVAEAKRKDQQDNKGEGPSPDEIPF